MRKRTSYIKGSKDFVNKVKHLQNTPESAILVTADVAVLYASIPYEVVLNALRVTLDNREHKSIDTESLIKIAEIVLKSNFFEFNGKVKRQMSSTTICPKSALSNACILIFLTPRKMHL